MEVSGPTKTCITCMLCNANTHKRRTLSQSFLNNRSEAWYKFMYYLLGTNMAQFKDDTKAKDWNRNI